MIANYWMDFAHFSMFFQVIVLAVVCMYIYICSKTDGTSGNDLLILLKKIKWLFVNIAL